MSLFVPPFNVPFFCLTVNCHPSPPRAIFDKPRSRVVIDFIFPFFELNSPPLYLLNNAFGDHLTFKMWIFFFLASVSVFHTILIALCPLQASGSGKWGAPVLAVCLLCLAFQPNKKYTLSRSSSYRCASQP